ncbi:hemolysin-III related-domain-containing protein [Globomyces pollinis-pini]|nr:hemolysin-III related-domain-containing protein [Globomyces pollinis-pini]
MFQLMYYSYYDLIHDTISASILDILAIGTFFIGAIVCLALSTVFHLCCCHSRVLYYGFFCDPFYQILYCASIFTLGGLTMYVTLGHKFATAQYRWLRTGIFVLLGSVGIVPLVHHLARYGTEMAMESISTNYILVMASCYLLGAFIYGYRIPERWYPETFDIFGHSHQIWHCLVVLGAAIHFMGIYRMSIWWHEHNPMCGVSDEVMVSWFI